MITFRNGLPFAYRVDNIRKIKNIYTVNSLEGLNDPETVFFYDLTEDSPEKPNVKSFHFLPSRYHY